MYFSYEGTVNDLGEPHKHNTLLQAKRDLITRIKTHETFCRKHDKEMLVELYNIIASVDSLKENDLLEVPARAWLIPIGGLRRCFRIEVHHG